MIGRNGWPFRIVIIEDSSEVRALIKHILEDAIDMAVVGEASSGPTTLKLGHLLAPDVTVIGPGVTTGGAIEATRALLQDHPATMVVAIRFDRITEDQVALVRAGVLTLLDYAECERLPDAIRRADQLQQELGVIRTGTFPR